MINADDLDHVLIGISIFFAIITFVVPFVFIKGPDQDIIRSCCVIAGISCYLFWLCTYISQKNPLVGPKLDIKTVLMIAREWGNEIVEEKES